MPYSTAPMGPVLVPLPASVHAAALSPEALADLAALRPLDALAPTSVLSPRAARERLRGALEAAGYALAGETKLDAGTPSAGVPASEVARFAKAPLDRWEPTAASRPLLRATSRPRGLELAAHARSVARAHAAFATAVDRLAHECDLEGQVLILERTAGPPPPEVSAFVRHRVACARVDARSLSQAASVLAEDLPAGIAPAAREALGFAARLACSQHGPAVAALSGPLARELDLALADALIAGAGPAEAPLAFLDREHPELIEPRKDDGREGALTETRRDLGAPAPREVDPRAETSLGSTDHPVVVALRDALRGRAPGGAAMLSRAALEAVAAVRALEAFRASGAPLALDALSSLELDGDTVLALALGAKHAHGLAPVERRRWHRRLARSLDGPERALVERALPELAGADALTAAGIDDEARASSRAERISARRRAGALALARTAELAREEPARRSELERARAIIQRASADGQESDWELVALAFDEALLAPDADRAPFAPRARAAIERWAKATERAPLGFVGPALRLLASVADDPFAGETKDPRRVEARLLYHLARRVLRGGEPPRELVEALVERRRSGVTLGELARRIDPTVATAFLFAMLPRTLAASLSDELGRPDEVRVTRRIDDDTLEGRFERRFVHLRFYPEDDPPLEAARGLVRAPATGDEESQVVRPLAALEASRVRGGLGVGWALVLAVPDDMGARLSPEDVPAGAAGWPFFAELARALAAQHSWGLVHGRLRLDAIRLAASGLVLTKFDVSASLAPLAEGRARDLEALLGAARDATKDADALRAIRAHAGDLGAEGAAGKLAAAFAERAAAGGLEPAAAGLLRVESRRAVDPGELRALLRDVLAFEGLGRSLAEIEARVPAYLAARRALDQDAIRHELLELAEEGWASGDFKVELDARAGTWRLAEVAP